MAAAGAIHAQALVVPIKSRKRPQGKQSPVSPMHSHMQDCGLGATIVVNYLAKPFVVCGVTVPGADTVAAVSRLQRTSFDGSVCLACTTLSRMRRCCRAMDALITPALAHSGIYGVCFLRFRYDMDSGKFDWFGYWPQTEWFAAHRADPAAARQLAIAWNTDGKTRPPSQLEAWRNRYSLPRGLVRIEFPHDLYPFTTRVRSDSDGISDESEDSSESEP